METAAPHAIRPEDDHPMNYPVANLGVDKDILATWKHLKLGEAKHGAWSSKKVHKEKSHPMNYPTVDLGMDKDIVTSLKNMNT